LPEASSGNASVYEPLALGQTRPRMAMRNDSQAGVSSARD
jgi:hypothetical protein